MEWESLDNIDLALDWGIWYAVANTWSVPKVMRMI